METISNGMKNRTEADIFYLVEEGRIISHYTYPSEYFRISDRLGEVKLYFPESNSVFIQRDPFLSSENELLHFFVYNKISDLGLQELGFKPVETKMDEGILVTTWKPINPESENIKKIVLAHENNMPLYMAYFDKKDKAIKKIYYSDYSMLSFCALPTTVVDISYVSEKDSVISRRQFMGLENGIHLKSSYFNFQVPEDAKRIEDLK